MAVNHQSEPLHHPRLDPNSNAAADLNQGVSVGAVGADASEDDGAHRSPKDKIKSVPGSTRCETSGCEMAPLRNDTGRRRRVLLSTVTPFSETLVRALVREPDIELRLISQDDQTLNAAGLGVPSYEDVPVHEPSKTYSSPRKWMNITAAMLADWADMLIVAPADSNTIGSILAGLSTTLTLTVFRGWDVSKTILLVPGMTLGEWKAPITSRQLNELRAYWPWVKILPPVFSRFEPPNTLVEMPWEGRELFYEEIRRGFGWSARNGGVGSRKGSVSNSVSNGLPNSHQRERISDGHDKAPQDPTEHKFRLLKNGRGSKSPMCRGPNEPALPMELLTMIFEELGDWEIARVVGVYNKIPMPAQWQRYFPDPSSPSAPLSLEYTILERPFGEIKEKLSTVPQWQPLSNLAAHLILRMGRIDVLDFLIKSRSDLYWATRPLTTLAFRASAIYGHTTLLDWWLACPDIPTNDYLPDAVDSASRAGFVHILDWWRNSGLPLRYTERALESASAEDQIAVLDWWKSVSESSPEYDPVPMKIGKSVLLAAQYGRTVALEWWDKSGIPFSHAESVSRIASTHGHVAVLDLWNRLKGSKLIFDNQVLVGATKNGHVDVLEWWRRSGLRVEFKTCDIEEALEDAVSGSEERVRQWWERNGLNLGVGTSEWMKVKVL